MKNLTKILGIVLAVVTVASMLVISAPAAAGIHTWTTVSTPSGVGFVVSDSSYQINDVYQLVYNSDKSVIYAAADVNAAAGKITTAAYAGAAIFKSTNSGRTWQLVKTGFEDTYNEVPWYSRKVITDIVTSPVNVNELYFTDGTTIYTSKDAGTTWTKLSSVFTWAVSNAWVTVPTMNENCIMTLALAQYGSVKLVFAGTATANVAAFGMNNGVFVCEESAFGMPWTDLDVLNQRATPFSLVNVHDIVIDPTDFATKQGVIAVVTADDAKTYITGKYLGNQWNQAAYFTDTEIGTDIADTYRATLTLPSDFSSNAASGKFQAWVGIATLAGTGGDVYLWIGSGSTAIDLNVSGAASNTQVTDLASTGAIAAPGLVVGGYTAADVPNVWYSAGGYAFAKNVKAPTGADSVVFNDFALTCVLPLSDFAASGKALVGTVGYGAAVSYTKDFCSTFNQISLMANSVASLDDMGSSVSSVFIVTSSAAGIQSVWKQVVIGTSIYWERIYSELPAHANTAPTGPPGLTDWDIEGTSDGSVFLADIGDTGIWRSADDGQTWVMQFTPAPAAINAWMPLSASSVLVGGVDEVYVTTTNGIVWFTYACAIGTITDFDAVGSTWLAAGVDGTPVIKVAQSTNSGVTWTTLKAGTGLTASQGVVGATKAYVAAAYDFATTGNVFIASNATGVFRYVTSAAVAADGWLQVDVPVGTPYDGNGVVTAGAGLVAGQGGPGSAAEGAGMVYVTDATAGEGVSRIKGLSTDAEALDGPSTVTFNGLWLTASGTDNVLWTLGDDNKIYTYTDTTNKAGSGVSVVGSTYSSIVIYGVDLQLFTGLGGWMTAVKWNAMPNVTWYGMYVTAVPNDPGSYNLYVADQEILGDIYYTTATTATVAMAPNTTYYISVWATDVIPAAASQLCSSFLFDKVPASYTTAPGVANWTPNLFPNDGASNVPVNANLAWDPVVGATGYELQIAKANAADPKVMPSGTATINLVGAGYAVSGLDYDTTYVWRVRAVSGTSKGEWVTSIFTTVKEELPVVTVEPAPTPTIIVTAPPQVTVTQAAPAVTPILTVPQATIIIQQPDVDDSTPAYIWIIVAIGALLTIAVVVLIIRTRRVV